MILKYYSVFRENSRQGRRPVYSDTTIPSHENLHMYIKDGDKSEKISTRLLQ